jgi:hypothetical protein
MDFSSTEKETLLKKTFVVPIKKRQMQSIEWQEFWRDKKKNCILEGTVWQ